MGKEFLLNEMSVSQKAVALIDLIYSMLQELISSGNSADNDSAADNLPLFQSVRSCLDYFRLATSTLSVYDSQYICHHLTVLSVQLASLGHDVQLLDMIPLFAVQ